MMQTDGIVLVTTLKQVINIKALFSSNLNGSNLQNSNLITSFLDICSDGVVIVDLEGKVLGVNKKFEELHGWTEEEVIGQILPMTPEEDRAEVFQII